MFVDDAVRFQAKLLARGFQGEKVVVRLKELEPGSRDPKTAHELESTEVDAPANGQPKRVELVYRPKTTGERTFILEVDPRPRELQTENNRIERVITVRKEKLKVLYVDSEPRYEFRYLKNYLERDETIDLNVVLLSSDPAYSQQDRSALPTFPAAKDDLFAYDVVLFGDADTSFLSQSQMQNLVEFVTEKGGGVLFIAGELFNPLSYRGTPLELLLPIELADARNPTAVGTSVNVVPPRADARGTLEPDLPLRRQRSREHADLGAAPRALLVLRGPAQEAGGAGAGRTPDGDRVRRQAAAGRSTISSVPARRCSMRSTIPGAGVFAPATSTSDGSGSRRSGSWRDRSWSASARPRSRPTASAISGDSRSSSASASPTPAWPPPSGDITVQVERRGQGPRKLALKLVPGTRNVFEGALPQAAGRGVRGPAPAAARPRGPDRHGQLPRRCAGQRVRTHRNERARADPGGRVHRRQVLHAARPPKPCSRTSPSRPRSRSIPIPPSRSGTPGPLLTLFLLLITAEWVFRKRKQMV